MVQILLQQQIWRALTFCRLNINFMIQESSFIQQRRVEQILKKLNIKSIDELLQSETINPDFISQLTNLHKSVVVQHLAEIHRIISEPADIVSRDKFTLELSEIVALWAADSDIYSSNTPRLKEIKVGSSELVQIIGRANCGKSFFAFSMVYYCLEQGLTVILLDSNQNYEQLLEFIKNKTEKDFDKYNQFVSKIVLFKFRSLSQFSILLHNLGNELIAQRNLQNSLVDRGVIVFIDCLSRVELADPDTDQQNATMDFDIIDRLKRLLVNFSIKAATVVYTNRSPTANTLFGTIYKNEKHRPRCKNNNAKLWDSIASKTIFIDYTRTMGNSQIKKIHFSKQISCEIFNFQKKLKK